MTEPSPSLTAEVQALVRRAFEAGRLQGQADAEAGPAARRGADVAVPRRSAPGARPGEPVRPRRR